MTVYQDAVAHLATHDPRRTRFGARCHDYRLGAPLPEARIAAIEAEIGVRLPADYRDHVGHDGDGGAGPYYGLLPLDHPAQLAIARGHFDPKAEGNALFAGVVGLAHVGCSYMTLLVLDGPHRGQVWFDGRATSDGVVPIATSFRDFVHEWVKLQVEGGWPRTFTTPGNCALPSALTAYLHSVEDKHGVARGQLSPEMTRDALSGIPDGGIANGPDETSPFWNQGDLVDLCAVCARTVENLAASGMRPAQVKPGTSPVAMRDRWP